MDASANLTLPYILPSQAQKHITHNEALSLLDAIVQLCVTSRSLATAPVEPADGDRYIVGGGATGLWAGWDGDVAAHIDGAWIRLTPQTGWQAFVEEEGVILVRTDIGWQLPGGGDREFAAIGIGTAPDATNRLAVKADSVLLSYDDVTPGSGHMRVTCNKNTGAEDAGIVLQTGWSTRALFGLLGNDGFTIKVSPDGSAFQTALCINEADGRLKLGGEPFFDYSTINVMGKALTGAGNSWFGMTVTNTNANLTSKGGAVLTGAPYNNAHNPFMVLGPWVTDSAHIIYYGGGGWGVPDATEHRFYAGAYEPETDNTATMAMSIDAAAVTSYRNLQPGADNAYSLGSSIKRWSVVYSATGTISTSDGRLKTVSGDVPLELEFVRGLKPVCYRWNTGGLKTLTRFVEDPMGKGNEDVGPCAESQFEPAPGARTHFGLIAQDVKALLDAHGFEDFAGWTLADKYDPESEQGLRYDQFIPVLIRAVQELATRMEQVNP